jgi:hypothetical protein
MKSLAFRNYAAHLLLLLISFVFCSCSNNKAKSNSGNYTLNDIREISVPNNSLDVQELNPSNDNSNAGISFVGGVNHSALPLATDALKPTYSEVAIGEKPIEIKTKDGISLTIVPGAIIDETGKTVKGKVKFEIRQALKMSDFIAARLQTTSGNRLLQSGGMFYINATQKNRKLKVNPAIGIQAKLPFAGKSNEQDYRLFRGVMRNNRLDWVEAKPGQTLQTPRPASSNSNFSFREPKRVPYRGEQPFTYIRLPEGLDEQIDIYQKQLTAFERELAALPIPQNQRIVRLGVVFEGYQKIKTAEHDAPTYATSAEFMTSLVKTISKEKNKQAFLIRNFCFIKVGGKIYANVYFLNQHGFDIRKRPQLSEDNVNRSMHWICSRYLCVDGETILSHSIVKFLQAQPKNGSSILNFSHTQVLNVLEKLKSKPAPDCYFSNVSELKAKFQMLHRNQNERSFKAKIIDCAGSRFYKYELVAPLAKIFLANRDIEARYSDDSLSFVNLFSKSRLSFTGNKSIKKPIYYRGLYLTSEIQCLRINFPFIFFNSVGNDGVKNIISTSVLRKSETPQFIGHDASEWLEDWYWLYKCRNRGCSFGYNRDRDFDYHLSTIPVDSRDSVLKYCKNREASEKKIQETFDNYVLNTYGTTLSSFGWYNCDRYYNTPMETVTIVVNNSQGLPATNVSVYVYNTQDMVLLDGFTNMEGKLVIRVPKNRQMKFIAINGNGQMAVSERNIVDKKRVELRIDDKAGNETVASLNQLIDN